MFNLISGYDYKWLTISICHIVKAGASLISTFNAKTRFKFDHLRPRKRDKDISSLKNHRSSPRIFVNFRQILFVDITICDSTRLSAQKSAFAHRCASPAKVNSRFSAQRRRFFKCVRRFDENCAYRREHLVKKASAICLIIEQYIEFSISFESSLTRAVNCSIVVPLSTSRVRWNRSSTASLEGVRSDEGQSNSNSLKKLMFELSTSIESSWDHGVN